MTCRFCQKYYSPRLSKKAIPESKGPYLSAGHTRSQCTLCGSCGRSAACVGLQRCSHPSRWSRCFQTALASPRVCSTALTLQVPSLQFRVWRRRPRVPLRASCTPVTLTGMSAGCHQHIGVFNHAHKGHNHTAMSQR